MPKGIWYFSCTNIYLCIQTEKAEKDATNIKFNLNCSHFLLEGASQRLVQTDASQCLIHPKVMRLEAGSGLV